MTTISFDDYFMVRFHGPTARPLITMVGANMQLPPGLPGVFAILHCAAVFLTQSLHNNTLVYSSSF
jgi:hypothetical protein